MILEITLGIGGILAAISLIATFLQPQPQKSKPIRQERTEIREVNKIVQFYNPPSPPLVTNPVELVSYIKSVKDLADKKLQKLFKCKYPTIEYGVFMRMDLKGIKPGWNRMEIQYCSQEQGNLGSFTIYEEDLPK